MKKLQSGLLGILIVAACTMAAFPPGPLRKSDAYLQPAQSMFGNKWDLGTANSDVVISTVPGGSIDLCIPFGSQTMLMTEGGNAVCTWTMTDDPTYDNNTDAAGACNLTDGSGPDGAGSCFTLKDGVPWNEVPMYQAIAASGIGARPGICSLPTRFKDQIVYPGCRVDADCTGATAYNISGATCDTSISSADSAKREEKGCASLVCQTETANTLLGLWVQK